ncbi:ACT domain-containing protein [Candidatus Micrarchaeota archaeon]|nr:ACT domain-containing protein [Candidatus Micrarchaeota archaeon]
MVELTVVAKDRVGLLADIGEILGKKGINIESVSVEASGKTAMVHLNLGHNAEGKKLLADAGFRVVDRDKLLLRLKDQPGELAKVSRTLANGNINIKNVYILDAERKQKILAVDTSDNAKARKLLKTYL